MNFFSRFQYWLQRFFYGRYGGDQLNWALLILYLLLWLLGVVTRIVVFPILSWLLFFLVLFRMLSRNTAKRWAENQKFLRVWNKVKGFFTTRAAQWRDKDHRYYKCPKCKNKLRVPRGKGKIQITCPVCRTEFIRKT
ncbi:hypothetical protein B5F35_06385 [Anaeromassilibacillus sp. An200]|nr:hypothetical protein B5F35_06385 [Anaeromassilibacillus sp. An200]